MFSLYQTLSLRYLLQRWPRAVLVVISGNNQIAAPSSALPDSLVVRLTDAFGNGIPGATLTWSAAAGNGTVTPAGTLTNASGRSAARWVVGPTSGTQTATSRESCICSCAEWPVATRRS